MGQLSKTIRKIELRVKVVLYEKISNTAFQIRATVLQVFESLSKTCNMRQRNVS